MLKKYLISVILICIVVFGVIYQNYYSEKEVTVYAMDTVMTIKIKGNRKYLDKAESVLRDIDSKYNAYNKNSYIYKLNSGEITAVPRDVAELIKFSLDVCHETEGNFNIALKDVKDLWSLESENPRIPSDELIEKALETSRYENIEVEGTNVYLNGTKIDLGGIVKGYATDCIIGIFKSGGVKEAVVDLGGNVYAYSNCGDVNIGIQKPFSQRGDVAGIISVNDKAVISSGIYERYFEKDGKVYHHIFNPDTGYPSDNSVSSVTVTGVDSALCDAYSTALLVMGEEKAAEFYKRQGNFEFAMICGERIICSPGFNIGNISKEYEIEIIN